jgi:hypothetical protein
LSKQQGKDTLVQAEEPSHNPDTGKHLYDLATASMCRFESTKKFEDVNEAVKMLQKALPLVNSDSNRVLRALCLGVLCYATWRRYDIKESEGDIDLAIKSGE